MGTGRSPRERIACNSELGNKGGYAGAWLRCAWLTRKRRREVEFLSEIGFQTTDSRRARRRNLTYSGFTRALLPRASPPAFDVDIDNIQRPYSADGAIKGARRRLAAIQSAAPTAASRIVFSASSSNRVRTPGSGRNPRGALAGHQWECKVTDDVPLRALSCMRWSGPVSRDVFHIGFLRSHNVDVFAFRCYDECREIYLLATALFRRMDC